MLRRIFRLGFNSAVRDPFNEDLIASAGKVLYRISLCGEVTLDHHIERGTRPISLTTIQGVSGIDDGVYYGEYFPFLGSQEVRIWGKTQNEDWKVVYTFPIGCVEHIHGLMLDFKRSGIWILTGDNGEAPGFWFAQNNFKDVQPIATGRQEYRACVAFPTSEGLLYATDTPLEKNSIRLLRESAEGWKSEAIYPMTGSSIYATQAANRFVFSTAVEPGPPSGKFIQDVFDSSLGAGILEKSAGLVWGNVEEGFSQLTSWKKDILPPRLGQFGTITFPSGIQPSGLLIYYGIALNQLNNITQIVQLDTVLPSGQSQPSSRSLMVNELSVTPTIS